MSAISDLHDRGAYRIAVGAIGVALIVVLAGLCVIVAVGKAGEIPQGLWTTASALGGGLLGLLAPPPAKSSAKDHPKVTGVGKRAGRALTILAKDVWANRSVVILLVIFGVAVGFGVAENSGQLQTLAGASGAALVGLLAPAPGASNSSTHR